MSAPDLGGAEPPLDVSVIVASHDRPLRLRWMLNALEEQTLPGERFEVIVVHDSRGPDTQRLLDSHPLAARGILRSVVLEPGSALPAAKRNLGWRMARAPLVAFTDDDCRPPGSWLERVLDAAMRHPGTVVQGTTLEDPDEAALMRAPFNHSQRVVPPSVWAEMCNITYPRDLLERLDGLDERLSTFEDTDVALRAQEQGVALVAAPEVLIYHSVHTPGVLSRLRGVARWRDAPVAVKRHPRLRRSLYLSVFWSASHAWLPVALVGVAAAARGRRSWALLLLPWARYASPPRYGRSLGGRMRSLLELPLRAAIDAGEIAILARHSFRHRTLLL